MGQTFFRSPRRRFAGAAAIPAACLFLLAPRLSRAEDFISYKYADYRESGGRIAVRTQGVLIEQDIGTDMKLKLQGVLDAIAGATPTGQPAPAGSDQVPLFSLVDHRKAWNADFSRQFELVNLSVGFANSRESDYISNGVSLNSLVDFNKKNTTLLVGIAGNDDNVKVTYQNPYRSKRSRDLILGLTQLLDPLTSVTLNLTWGTVHGYQSDPYKVVAKTVELDPGDFVTLQFLENRPEERTRFVALASLNRSWPALHGAVEGDYRFYHDTFGTTANTVELSWLQQLGPRLVLKPEFRVYQQTAADFYHYNFDLSPVTPVFGLPPVQGPFYSSDYRLSALRAVTWGMKATCSLSTHFQVDLEVQQYDMRGRDSLVPRSAYPSARVITAGARFSW